MEQFVCEIEPYISASNNNLSTKTECGICGENHITMNCSLVQITCHIPDKLIPSKARLSLPEFLEVRPLVDQSFDVYSKELIPRGTQFGPFQAKLLINLKPAIQFPLKIFTNDDDEEFSEYFLDTSEEAECSWLYFISPATNIEEQNLICYQDSNDIYYGSIKDIKPGDVLKVWYSRHYALKMNMKVLEPVENEESEENIDPKDISVLVKSQQKIMKRDIWNCKFCGKLEKNIATFAKHLLEHYRLQLKKKCELCKATFSCRKNLKKHFKVVHASQFNTMPSKEPNIISTTKTNPEIKEISLGGPLLNDILTDSLDNSNLILQHTDLNQFDLGNIESHNILLDTENFNMDNLLHENVKELDHFNFELNDAEEDIVCDVCLRVFTKLKNLIQHLEQHTGSNYCKTCNKVFCRKENLNAHACFGVYQYPCTHCKKVFIQKKYLKRHMEIAHLKKFTCEICSLFFLSKEGLNTHACKGVTRERKFYCTECPKGFLSEKSLKGHMRRHFQKTPPKLAFVCEFCSKGFAHKGSFNAHVKTHDDPKLSCNICDRRFHRIDVLNNHMTSHVTEAGTYPCPVCSKQCKSKKLLYFHKKVHQDGKYKCSECPASYKQKNHLNKHKSVKHKKEFKISDSFDMYECPLCDKKLKLKSSVSRHLKRTHPKFQDLYLLNINRRKYKLEKKTKVEPPSKDLQTDSDLNIMDLKETIENMNFTTDISMGGNDENNINMEFEDMLKSTTDNMDFLNESSDGIVENLLSIPINSAELEAKDAQKEICLSMPDLSEHDQEIKLGNNAFILENGTIVEPQDNTGKIVYYILGEKVQV